MLTFDSSNTRDTAFGQPKHTVTFGQATQPMDVTARVNNYALPIISQDTFLGLYEPIYEAQNVFDRHTKAGMAIWFAHMLNLHYVSHDELRHAFTADHPYMTLNKVFTRTLERVSNTMGRLVDHHRLSSEPLAQCAYLDVEIPADYRPETFFRLHLEQGYCFAIDTILDAPRHVFNLLMQAIQLIDELCVPCLQPHHFWNHDLDPFYSDKEYEYLQIVEQYQNGGLTAAARCVSDHHFEFFSDDPEYLEDGIREFEQQQSPFEDYRPAIAAKLTRQTVLRIRNQAMIERRRDRYAPWLNYVRYVGDTLLSLFPNDKTIRTNTSWGRGYDDDEVDFSHGVVVSCETDCETEGLDTLYQMMGEAGEQPAMQLDLNRIASPKFQRKLDLVAHGFGLLFRGADVNDVMKGNRR